MVFFCLGFFCVVNIVLKTLSDGDCIASSDELFDCLFKYLAYEIICINCNKRSYKNLCIFSSGRVRFIPSPKEFV